MVSEFHYWSYSLCRVIVGLETSPSMMEQYGAVLKALDKVVLSMCVLEIVMKMGAQGNLPWLYFRNPWNVFDFVIVAVCLLPLNS